MGSEMRRVLWIGVPPERLAGQYALDVVESVPAGIARLRIGAPNAVVAVLPLDGWTAEEVLEEIQRIDTRLPVILLDPECTIERALRRPYRPRFFLQ